MKCSPLCASRELGQTLRPERLEEEVLLAAHTWCYCSYSTQFESVFFALRDSWYLRSCEYGKNKGEANRNALLIRFPLYFSKPFVARHADSRVAKREKYQSRDHNSVEPVAPVGIKLDPARDGKRNKHIHVT